MPTTVEFLNTFDKQIDRLERKYPGTIGEVRGLVRSVMQGDRPGRRIPRIGRTVYKVRLANPAAQRGKSGGFRVIYYAQFSDRIILLTIYSKTDKTDISAREIQELAQEADGAWR